jgi:AraC-like DNA-binding protein
VRVPPALRDCLTGPGVGYVCGFRHVLGVGPSCSMHCHLGAEIVYHPSGEGVTTLKDGRRLAFGAGAVVFYPPWTHHDQRMDAPGTDLCIQFDFRGRTIDGLEAGVLLPKLKDPVLRSELQQLAQAHPAAAPLARAALDHRVTALVIGLLLAAEDAVPAPREAAGHAERARDYIARHHQRLAGLEEVAEHLGVGLDHLRHCFRERYGSGMSRWLTEVRVERAKDLLMHSIMPLRAVAEASGFANEYYFSTVFRQETGEAPGRFRRRHVDADPSRRARQPRR